MSGAGTPEGRAAAGREERRKVIYADLEAVSDRLSTQVRQLAFGVLAIVWALLIKDEGAAFLRWSPRFLMVLTGIAVLAMTVDFLQYVAAYVASTRARLDLKKEDGTGRYRRSWISYRLRQWCFVAKIVISFVLVIVFLAAVGWSVARSSADPPSPAPAATADA